MEIYKEEYLLTLAILNIININIMKKRKEGKTSAWISVIFLMLWSISGIFLIFETGFSLIGLAMWLLFAMIPFSIAYHTIKTNQHEYYLEFFIHEYEKWNHKETKYEKKYIVSNKELMSRFIFHWYTGNYEQYMNHRQIEDYINGLINNEYNTWYGYYTKEEAMIDIINRVKSLIANKKATENIKIRNIATLETFTLDELITRVESGEFK